MREYTYTDLNRLNVGSDPVNVYGVVLDATFPHKSFKSNKYICSYKIANSSSPVDKQGIVEYTSVVFFAKSFTDLPVCQRIGEIIRIHRASVGTYKDHKQLSVNMFFNSSWVLFPPAMVKDDKPKKVKVDPLTPLSFSGKDFHMNRLVEKKVISQISAWASKLFAS